MVCPRVFAFNTIFTVSSGYSVKSSGNDDLT